MDVITNDVFSINLDVLIYSLVNLNLLGSMNRVSQAMVTTLDLSTPEIAAKNWQTDRRQPCPLVHDVHTRYYIRPRNNMNVEPACQ